MKFTSTTPSGRQEGYALILVMSFLAVSLIVFGSMMYWVSTNAKITLRNNYFNAAEAAAESGSETIIGTMLRDYRFGALNPAGTYTGLRPGQTGWPLQYDFSNVGVTIGTTNWQTLSSQFAGLNGLVQNCTVTATATATNGSTAVPATIQQKIQFASIPLFQYAIFYNMDLEICPGAAMNILGHVHSNNNIWATGSSSSQPLTFSSYVDASGFYTNSRSPNDPQSWSKGNINFQLTLNNPLNNSDSLSMPIGTNNNPAAVAGIIQLPPDSLTVPSAAAYSPTGQVYLYNAADLIITNRPGGTNFAVFYNNPNATTQLTPVPPDVVVVSTNTVKGVTTYITNAYYSFVTNATFYDYRESDAVQAVQLNVSNLVVWLTNNTVNPVKGVSLGGSQYDTMNNSGSTSKGHGINSVYVFNSVPLTSSQLPAVRLVNGQQLPPNGLTVATAQPLYVMGNYNIQTNKSGAQALTLGSTTNGATVPAALIGDSVTILSGNWKDSYTSGTALGSRTPTATTINAACMEGIVPSITVNGTKKYSGGVENFLRLLENWSSSIALTYNGSIVVMFPSQYATNYWQSPGVYYNPPNRQWGFDLNFTKGQQYLPPLTPQVKYVIRNSWAAW